MDGWLATLLVARNSYPLRIPVAVEVYPALADHLIGLVDVVQALKLKLGVSNYSGQSPSRVCAQLHVQANLCSYSVTSLKFNHGGMYFVRWPRRSLEIEHWPFDCAKRLHIGDSNLESPISNLLGHRAKRLHIGYSNLESRISNLLGHRAKRLHIGDSNLKSPK